MKIVGIAVLVLLLLLVSMFVYVGYNTNSIVKNAIETIGPQYLGAPVRVEAVDISLQDGQGTLSNLEIGNPPGFHGPYALRVGTLSVTLDAANSSTGLIVLKRVEIDGAQVVAIARSAKDTNFRALAGTRASEASPIRLIIEQFDLTDIQATVSVQPVSKNLYVHVPDVHLRDIGRTSGGAGVGEILGQILAPITKAITRSLTAAGMQGLGVDPNQLKSDAQQKLRDAMRNLGHPAN